MKPSKTAKSKSPPPKETKETLPIIDSQNPKQTQDSRSKSPKEVPKNQKKGVEETQKIKEEVLINQIKPLAQTEIPKKDKRHIEEEHRKRIKYEKEQEKKDKELFDKILSEAKHNNFKSQSVRATLETQGSSIKISEKKAQAILENGGMLDAYKHVIASLCKNGLPTGNLFEYAAYVVQDYEKKWKEKKSKETKAKLEKYWSNKEVTIIGNANVEKDEKTKLNRSLEEREMNKYIRSLDRSRSSKRIKEKRSQSRPREDMIPKDPNDIVNIQQAKDKLESTLDNKAPKTSNNKGIAQNDKSPQSSSPVPGKRAQSPKPNQRDSSPPPEKNNQSPPKKEAPKKEQPLAKNTKARK